MLRQNNAICVGLQKLYNLIYAARVAPEKTILHRPAISVSVKSTDEVRLNMATLSLKKAKQLAVEKPTEDLIGKYAVMRQARNARSMRFTVFHDKIDIAFNEAYRLSLANPTERFLVILILCEG